MKRTILLFSVAGLMFSGYLSAVKFLSKACALGETCPLFLGQPACYFGFGMYLLITIFAYGYFSGLITPSRALKTILLVSGLGILFAGYFTVRELPTLFQEGLGAYAMGLPTCAWGLLFYLTIFILAWRSKSRVIINPV